jgi:16S rRNA (cytidine1402-2'-O)-methyltransferase
VTARLVVCPTPIGNLEDVTLRVLSALREADVVACEDTRRTRVLLDRYGVRAQLVSYHEHNEQARSAELVSRMRSGAVVALVSDAGMPLVSDPGYVLVRACVAAGLPVEVLPGPSAAITALVASGLPADEWRFHGFLPRKKGELRRLLSEPGGTLVAFESPRRVPATLALLADVDPDRDVAVCRELTKVHEEIVRGSAAELAARYAEAAPKGEVVLVVGPAASSPAGAAGADPAALDALRRLVDAGAHPRKAAAIVAELTGGSANALYRSLTAADWAGAAPRSAVRPASLAPAPQRSPHALGPGYSPATHCHNSPPGPPRTRGDCVRSPACHAPSSPRPPRSSRCSSPRRRPRPTGSGPCTAR